MKRVACLSTIQSLPSDTPSSYQVIDIFNSTRSYNLEQQITGAFVIFNNMLLILIEGDSTRLANIVFTLRNDKRLTDFSVIVNTDIKKPEFTSWGIKLIRQNNEGQSRFFEKLHNIFKNDLDIKSRQDEQRLDVFLNLPQFKKAQISIEQSSSAADQRENELDFRQAIISLSGWPKPGKIRLTPELIKICSRLVGRPERFEDLLNAKTGVSEESLIAHLTALQNLDILKKHRMDDKPKLIGIKGGLADANRPSSTDRFSMVLRNFLSAQK